MGFSVDRIESGKTPNEEHPQVGVKELWAWPHRVNSWGPGSCEEGGGGGIRIHLPLYDFLNGPGILPVIWWGTTGLRGKYWIETR